MAREPMVPLVAFNQMNNNLMRLIEQDSQARRDHEERIAKAFEHFAERIAVVIAEAVRPLEQQTPSARTLPIQLTEEEEDLRFARDSGQIDKEAFDTALSEIEFALSSGQIEFS